MSFALQMMNEITTIRNNSTGSAINLYKFICHSDNFINISYRFLKEFIMIIAFG